ncbi:MAG TPA: hypothetical protein VJA22_00020 [Patescibacteria group bacterium]|nr:hypothetical protein [Patescibacteria group bacterium]
MKVYFYAQDTSQTEDKNEYILYSDIKKQFLAHSFQFYSNREKELLQEIKHAKGKLPFDFIDIFALRQSKENDEYQDYIISFALARKKRILYIKEFDTEKDRYLNYLEHLAQRDNRIKIIRSQDINHEIGLFCDFVKLTPPTSEMIKFTLRLNKKLHREFTSKCRSQGTQKSKVLRTLLNNYIVQ